MPASFAGRLVALALPPGDAFVAAAERVWDGGGAILPLDPAAPVQACRRLVDALHPHLVLDAAGEREGDPDAEPLVGGVRVVIATSGSTGEPKGVELTADALEASARATTARLGIAADDVWLSCLPWQHIGGLQVLLRARLGGNGLVVHQGFDVDLIARTDATLVSLVPTQLARLLDAGVGLSRFRVVLLGGAAAPWTLLARARDAGAPVVTTYGMTETCGGCVYDGRPLDGVEVRADDATGRVMIRGPVLMHGYRLRPELTRQALADGWLRTEDLGAIDDDGTLRVHGRADDVVVTGGENVATAAVAELLAAHPSVREVAVTGVLDVEWGERVVAVVVPGPTPPTLEALRDWVKERASASAAPRQLVLVDRIPRLTSGKPDRLAVRALAQDAVALPRSTSQSASPPSTT